MSAAKRQTEIGLVLQGGGALGAYEWGALTALLELMDEAAAHGQPIVLKAVSGVSIGAINAACVVGSGSRADARLRLAALWEALALETPLFWPAAATRDLSFFGLPGFYAARQDFWTFPRWTYWYDNNPLVATLTRNVDFAALNASDTAFVVTAVDVESGALVRFSNKPRGDEPPAEITPRHVLASGSLPPAFSWTAIAGHRYWDGGIVDNTPLGDVIEAFSPSEGIDRLLVVMNLYPLRARLPQNFADVEDRLHELQFGNRVRQDGEVARRINALVETVEDLATLVPRQSLDPRLQARLDEARRYKIIDAITHIDMQDPDAASEPGAQEPFDDQNGLRDFSLDTVKRRRALGYAIAERRLRPLFESHGLITEASARRTAAMRTA